MFSLPAITPKDLALRAGLSIVANTRAATVARVALLRQLRTLEKELLDSRGLVKHANIDELHQRLACTDPDQWSAVTVSQAKEILLPEKETTPSTLYAIHHLLMNAPRRFQADPLAYLTSQTFHVRPRSHVQELEVIDNMRQSRSPAFYDFVGRAREVIIDTRARANESKGEPATLQPSERTIWTPDDKLILGFLLHALRPSRGTQTDPYQLSAAFIMLKLHPQMPDFHDGLLHKTLIDLGVIPPWHDVTSRKPELRLDLVPESMSPAVKEQNAIAARHLKLHTRDTGLTETLGPEDFYATDNMASLRHDFGDMPVYVIDDVGAEELDDGISIERIPSEPDSDWVHVHIADPTTILPPTHVFSLDARKKLESIYYVHRTWPMLPRSLTCEGLGIGSRSSKGLPEHVMTFSLKVDKAGDIVDYAVRAGIVRNVHTLNYDGVDLAMGVQPPLCKYPFGGSPPLPPPCQLDSTHLDNLRALERVKDRLLAKRLTMTSFALHIPRAELSLSPRGIDDSPSVDCKPTHFRGFPDLTYRVLARELQSKGSRVVISELMKGASRVASRFCRDRGIPAVRRAGGSVSVPSEVAFADLIAMRGPDGLIDYSDALRYEVVSPQGEFTLETKMHWALGVPEGEGYLRVTSPLRRFSDMAMHWQIKNALLNPTAKPLFSEDYLRELIIDMTVHARSQMRNGQHHQRFWGVMFLQRWTNGLIPRDPLFPDPLDNLVAVTTRNAQWNTTTKEKGVQVHIEGIGLEAFLKGFGIDEEPMLGQRFNVEVDDWRLGTTPLIEVVRK
jgi:exoribonuclease II